MSGKDVMDGETLRLRSKGIKELYKQSEEIDKLNAINPYYEKGKQDQRAETLRVLRERYKNNRSFGNRPARSSEDIAIAKELGFTEKDLEGKE